MRRSRPRQSSALAAGPMSTKAAALADYSRAKSPPRREKHAIPSYPLVVVPADALLRHSGCRPHLRAGCCGCPRAGRRIPGHLTVDQGLFQALQWRCIGPYRGGRALAVTGVAGDPTTYYFGAVAGGVWKTTDAGATWSPLTDQTPISSVGALAVAASDHNVIYVGTGEAAPRGDMTYGDGV